MFVSQERFCSLWSDLQKDKPELLGILEGVLVHAVSHLQDSTRERDGLEQALRRYGGPEGTNCETFFRLLRSVTDSGSSSLSW